MKNKYLTLLMIRSKNERKLEKIILWIVNHILKVSTVENNSTFNLLSDA